MNLDDVTAIVPAFNESEGIGPTVQELIDVGIQPYNIIVVDGGSTDGTPEIASKLGVRVVRQRGRGKADAIRCGLKHARTPLILVIDADHTYPAKYVPLMVNALKEGGYDEVIGVRPGSSQPLVYRVGNALLTWLFDSMFGVRLRDVLSGLYLVRREAIADANFEMGGFSVESEIAAHIVSTGGSVGEVDIEYRKRLGRKKLRPWHGLSIALDMVRLSWRYNPTSTLFLAGALLMVPGLLVGGMTAYQFYFMHVDHFVNAIMALVVTATGFNSLLLGILSMYLKRMEYRLLKHMRSMKRGQSSG
ncbi:Glycosyl transferase, family 2 [Acidilobus saccharovorans 345-15]|uniref:Glycosyl transferase, family 2 n=1 Tax=Acidilobus saccharovorans (strain DSM 16705 / JCM 18335 / VKM B-2471 / 345-15) TaxID=666510 RepID=D9PZK0_ACIS3|nr:glycosyltransferase family 2 protein [Acidilobus saccharovorans]ADL18488.1 Glycosyl transferase, family 2 [Acidilobus saccharovorans 345-15]